MLASCTPKHRRNPGKVGWIPAEAPACRPGPMGRANAFDRKARCQQTWHAIQNECCKWHVRTFPLAKLIEFGAGIGKQNELSSSRLVETPTKLLCRISYRTTLWSRTRTRRNPVCSKCLLNSVLEIPLLYDKIHQNLETSCCDNVISWYLLSISESSTLTTCREKMRFSHQ